MQENLLLYLLCIPFVLAVCLLAGYTVFVFLSLTFAAIAVTRERQTRKDKRPPAHL